MKANTFQDLKVWQKAHSLVLGVYRISRDFPEHELFGLSSQMRRAAVSIAANIAEGFKKRTERDKLRFFNVSQGSIEEVRYYLILAQDLGYGDSTPLKAELEEVSRLLEAYMRAIRTRG